MTFPVAIEFCNELQLRTCKRHMKANWADDMPENDLIWSLFVRSLSLTSSTDMHAPILAIHLSPIIHLQCVLNVWLLGAGCIHPYLPNCLPFAAQWFYSELFPWFMAGLHVYYDDPFSASDCEYHNVDSLQSPCKGMRNKLTILL